MCSLLTLFFSCWVARKSHWINPFFKNLEYSRNGKHSKSILSTRRQYVFVNIKLFPFNFERSDKTTSSTFEFFVLDINMEGIFFLLSREEKVTGQMYSSRTLNTRQIAKIANRSCRLTSIFLWISTCPYSISSKVTKRRLLYSNFLFLTLTCRVFFYSFFFFFK